jgi:hypothetical protein
MIVENGSSSYESKYERGYHHPRRIKGKFSLTSNLAQLPKNHSKPKLLLKVFDPHLIPHVRCDVLKVRFSPSNVSRKFMCSAGAILCAQFVS